MHTATSKPTTGAKLRACSDLWTIPGLDGGFRMSGHVGFMECMGFKAREGGIEELRLRVDSDVQD